VGKIATKSNRINIRSASFVDKMHSIQSVYFPKQKLLPLDFSGFTENRWQISGCLFS